MRERRVIEDSMLFFLVWHFRVCQVHLSRFTLVYFLTTATHLKFFKGIHNVYRLCIVLINKTEKSRGRTKEPVIEKNI